MTARTAVWSRASTKLSPAERAPVIEAESGPTPHLDLLFDAALLVTNIVERRLAPLQLSFAPARSLIAILLSPDPLTPTDIAGLLIQEVQSVSTLLTRLNRRGLVEKRPHPLDRRSTFIALTSAGEAAAQASLDAFRAAASELRPILGLASAPNTIHYDLEQVLDVALAAVPMSVNAYRRRLDAFWRD